MIRLFYQKNTWLYLLILISVILLLADIINKRFYMHDLEVYYRTAARLVQGQELYRIKAHGHYVFKYSPISAIYFIPFLLLPFTVAKVGYWLLLTFLVGFILNIFYKLTACTEEVSTLFRQKNTVLLLTFIAVVTHIHREWHLGQVNLLLLALYVSTLHSLIYKKYKIAAFTLAFSLFIKPFGLIFLPYLFLKKKYQTLLYTTIFVLVLGLLPLLFYPSLAAFKQLYLSWFQELAIELRAKQSLLNAGNHTIFSVIARYTPLRNLLSGATAARFYQLSMLGLIGFILLFFIQKGRHLRRSLVAEGAVLIALIPLFAFTSINAFLFSAPCLVFLLYNFPQLPAKGKIALAVACILIGGNIRDLMGKRIFDLLENNSTYTLGTLILLGLMFYLRQKFVRAEVQADEKSL